MILSISTPAMHEHVVENAPNGVHRNHVILSGVPYYSDPMDRGIGFALLCEWQNGSKDMPIGVAVTDPALQAVTKELCASAKWAVVEGYLTLVVEHNETFVLVVPNRIEFS